MKKLLLSAAVLLAVALGVYAANELSVAVSIAYNNGFDSENKQVGQSINVTGVTRYASVLTVTNNATVPIQVNLSGIATGGYCYARNISATNVTGYIRLSSITNSTSYLVSLAAGEPSLFRLDSTNLFINTSAGTHNLELRIFSN